MTEERTYNGWPTYETWLAYSWITNEEASYDRWRTIALAYSTAFQFADRLRSTFEIENPLDTDSTGRTRMPDLYSGLMDAAISTINFDRLADRLWEDAHPPDLIHDEPDGTGRPDLHIEARFSLPQGGDWLNLPETVDLNISIRTLLTAYIACTEYGNDHDLDCYIPQSYDENAITYGSQDYLILDDDEADTQAEESLQELWNDCYASAIPDNLEHYMDEKQWIEDAINFDGRGSTLNHYDGQEHEIKADGKTFRNWLIAALVDENSDNWEMLGADPDDKPAIIDLDYLTFEGESLDQYDGWRYVFRQN